MSETGPLSQLVLRERQARDRGWWARMRECYWPDSAVRLSWFRGSGPDFVTQSEAMAERGQASTHRMSPPVVTVHGDRAVIEAAAAIEVRAEIDSIQADLTSYTRLIYRAERRTGTWRIRSLDPIYERDVLAAALPGAPLRIDPAELTGLRAPYRLLAWHLRRLGYDIPGDLYGDDQPDAVKDLYDAAFSWMEGTSSP